MYIFNITKKDAKSILFGMYFCDVSVSMSFLRAYSWAFSTLTIMSQRSICVCLSQSCILVLPLADDDYTLLRHTIFLQQ